MQCLFIPTKYCIRARKIALCAGNFTFAGREDDGDVKLHAATVAESITNWPEVVDKLRGTRFEKYLTMDGSVLP